MKTRPFTSPHSAHDSRSPSVAVDPLGATLSASAVIASEKTERLIYKFGRFRAQETNLINSSRRLEKMKSIARASLLLLLLSALGWAAQDVVTAVHGTITKLDSASRTMVVKTKDGTEHTIKFADKTAVHGARESAKATETGAKDTFHG